MEPPEPDVFSSARSLGRRLIRTFGIFANMSSPKPSKTKKPSLALGIFFIATGLLFLMDAWNAWQGDGYTQGSKYRPRLSATQALAGAIGCTFCGGCLLYARFRSRSPSNEDDTQDG